MWKLGLGNNVQDSTSDSFTSMAACIDLGSGQLDLGMPKSCFAFTRQLSASG